MSAAPRRVVGDEEHVPALAVEALQGVAGAWHRLVPKRTTPSMSATRFTLRCASPTLQHTAKQVGGAAERVDADTLVVPVEHVEEVGE